MKIIRVILASVFMIAMSSIIILTAMNLPYEGITRILSYEGILLFVSIGAIGICWMINKRKPEALQLGNINAKGKRNRLFLIKDQHSWRTTGIITTISITAVTSTFMIMGMVSMNKGFSHTFLISNLHWIILFSIVNAFGEEVIYRIIPFEIMKGETGQKVYPYVSGIIFGLAHFWGNPGGPFGVFVSGLLGFFLARSVVETKGSFWALLIHFLQDIVIFGVLFSFGMLA